MLRYRYLSTGYGDLKNKGGNKKMKRRKVDLIAIAAVVAVAMFAGCVEEETPTKVPETTAPPTETATPIPTLTPVATPTPETPTELSLKVGETAKTSKIEVTVISAKKTNHYEYYSDILKETMIEEASPGKIFILAEIEIKNIGSDRAYVGSSEFSMTDSEGYRYDPELYYGNDELEMFKELYQNQKMRGKVLFEVPEDATGLKIQYDFGSLFTKVKLASWELE